MNRFDKSVFINCPFDISYSTLLHAMLFTVVTLGLEPRIAFESTDSGENRLDKIVRLVHESKYSIHDISKIRAEKRGEYARLNMPFEIGIDYGCRRYSALETHTSKKFLILGNKKYEYMKSLSDISGFDIQYHENDTYKLISSIRNWCVTNVGKRFAYSQLDLWYMFTDYDYKYNIKAKKMGYSGEQRYEMPLCEKIEFIREVSKGNT